MPRKLRIPKARYQDVNPFMLDYLRTGQRRPPVNSASSRAWWQCFRITGPQDHGRGALREIWTELREELLDIWIAERPGTRPAAWWLFDAPRWRFVDRPARWRHL
jgi:hypothetical protein